MTRETIKVAAPMLGEEEVAAVREVLLSGQYASGPRVADFETEFAAYVGVEHAVATNSGTSALQAALFSVGVCPGDEVIVPPLTFFSTVTAVIHQNGVPVFADLSLDNYCLSPDDFARRITPRTKAVIPVHYFGHMAEMNEINAIASDRGIAVIEDAAQAHGSEYHGKRAGSLGNLGAFSFYATKHMTTGEGGMVTTDNADWAAAMRLFRNHGLRDRDNHIALGNNFRMSEMCAAIGRVQLTKLEDNNARRIRNSETLLGELRSLEWLTLPAVPDHVRHTYYWCPVLVDEGRLGMSTRALIAELGERGVETRNRYVAPLYRQTILTTDIPPALRLAAGDDLPDYGSLRLENAETVAGRIIGLPNRPDMSDADIDRVARALHEIAGG